MSIISRGPVVRGTMRRAVSFTPGGGRLGGGMGFLGGLSVVGIKWPTHFLDACKLLAEGSPQDPRIYLFSHFQLKLSQAARVTRVVAPQRSTRTAPRSS